MSDAKRLAEIRNHSVYHADWWAEKVGPTIEMPLENRSIQFLLSYTEKLEARIAKLRTALTQIRDYVDTDPENAHPADCALMARQALVEDEK